MSPTEAIDRAINEHLARCPAPMADAEYLEGLAHAKRCLHDLPELVRHIRDQVPEYDHALKAKLTRALLLGCDT